jgi:hypothetical protein
VNLKKHVYERQSKVDQDDQRCHIEADIGLGRAVHIAESLGAFWFRNIDYSPLDGRTDRNLGFENTLKLTIKEKRFGASWTGECLLENQFQANYPRNRLSASGGAEYERPELEVKIDASGSKQHDFPVSEALRGFEERTVDDKRIETTLNKPLVGGVVVTELSFSAETHKRDYEEQPNKNRQEGDDALAGKIGFFPTDSLSLSLSVERGFYQDVTSTLQREKIDRRVERRSLSISGDWRWFSWLELVGQGRRSLHRTDHQADTASDDGDDLDDLYDLMVRIRPASRLEMESEFQVDSRKERYLRAKWAPFSLDRSAYTLSSHGEYRFSSSISMSTTVTFLSTITDYLYAKEDSSFLLDRRFHSGVIWTPRSWELTMGAMVQFRTTGRLSRGKSGDARIIPSRREIVSSADFGCGKKIGEHGTATLQWNWRESAVEGFAPVPIHDVSFDLSMYIGESTSLTLQCDDRYRPNDERDRHLLTVGVSVDVYF